MAISTFTVKMKFAFIEKRDTTGEAQEHRITGRYMYNYICGVYVMWRRAAKDVEREKRCFFDSRSPALAVRRVRVVVVGSSRGLHGTYGFARRKALYASPQQAPT